MESHKPNPGFRLTMKTLLTLMPQVLCLSMAMGQSVVYDPTFGQGDGIVDYGVVGTSSDAVLFSDGSIAVTTWYSNRIVKLDAVGDFDPEFGSAGSVEIDLPGINDVFVAIALTGDEQLLILGRSRVGDFKQAHLLRLLADGSVDITFGNNGMFTYADTANEVTAYDLDVGSDGRIFVVGTFSGQITATSGNWFISALSAEGQLDMDFGQSGLVYIDVGGYAYCERVEELSDGSLLLAGSRSGFVLVKTLADGSLDQSFGTNGQVFITQQEGVYLSDGMSDLLVMPDGNFLCAGEGVDPPLTWGYGMLASLSPAGTLDNGFAGNGLSVLTTSGFLGSSITSIQRDPQGRIIALIGSGGSNLSMLARFTIAGQIDLGFGTTGYFEVEDDYRALLVQPDGKVLLIGEHNSSGSICRLNLQTWTSVPDPYTGGQMIQVVTRNGTAHIQLHNDNTSLPINWTLSDMAGRALGSGRVREVSLTGSPELVILRVQVGNATAAFKLTTMP